MNKLILLKWVVMPIVLLVFFTACKEDDDKVFKSDEISFQGGKVWSEFEKDDNDAPLKLTIVINDAAMAGLDRTGGPGHEHLNSVVVEVPEEAEALTVFKHIWLNWNPMGHPPMTVYDVPHFDFHFYTVSSPERETYIDTTKLNKSLSPAYLPANHVGVDPVPQMGKHYIDVTSPEFSGAPFTQTFIYGSNDGKLIFMEPMITEAFIKSLTTPFSRSIPQPSKFQVKGNYPTKMSIEKSNGLVKVSFEAFVLRQAE